MAQIYGSVEFQIEDEWYDVINISSLLLKHCDLNACLFGVDNHAGFAPLFADRGIPHDCSANLNATVSKFVDDENMPSWALYSELLRIDWHEPAMSRDGRIHEYKVRNDGVEEFVTKWLNKTGYDGVRELLETENEVKIGDRVFRRPIIRREDAIVDTHFGLLMKLMACLAERFGEDGVRLVVWFD
ncbi:hypothetical protein WMF30_21600 [Sorangium sp. So ce134]